MTKKLTPKAAPRVKAPSSKNIVREGVKTSRATVDAGRSSVATGRSSVATGRKMVTEE